MSSDPRSSLRTDQGPCSRLKVVASLLGPFFPRLRELQATSSYDLLPLQELEFQLNRFASAER